MATGRMEFGFDLSGRPHATARPAGEQPMRILVVANLGGGSRAPLAQRAPLAVDLDSLGRAYARIAPGLELSFDDGQPDLRKLDLSFASIEDFHPDRLYRTGAFATLRQLRAELATPGGAARAAAALGAASPPPDASAAEGDAEAITRLLGRAPAARAPENLAQSVVDRLAREAVAPHVASEQPPEATLLAAEIDRRVARQMAELLHHPAFQALEAAWRGIQQLVSSLELGDSLQLQILDASRGELQADVIDNAADLSRSRLCAILCGEGTRAPEGSPWSLVVCDFAFGPGLDDVLLLAGLGALGAAAGAPVLAAARLEALGCVGVDDLARPENWQPLPAEDAARWTKLRQSGGAPWIGLALPRVLGRLPYGARSDAVESFGFEEAEGAVRHGDFLWMNPAWSLALLLGQAFQEEGWSLDPDRSLDVADLPSHSFRDAQGEVQQQPCAEVAMGEAAAEAVLARGIMPLLSYRSRNAARLLRWQSIAAPAQRLGKF